MIYVLGQVEWNNGLPTPKFIGEYNTLDKAMKAFDEYVKGIKIFWESENVIFKGKFSELPIIKNNAQKFMKVNFAREQRHGL